MAQDVEIQRATRTVYMDELHRKAWVQYGAVADAFGWTVRHTPEEAPYHSEQA